MNTNSGHRLKEWREINNLSQRALGSVMGVSQGYIGNIEAGRSEPSRNFLQNLSERFGVSADWILYGTGVAHTERTAGFAVDRTGKRIEPPDLGMPLHGHFQFGTENFFMIQRMDLDVSAGHGVLPVKGGEHEMLAFPRSWVLQHRLNPDLAVLVRVKGDSMAPTIPDGALILVDCLDKDWTSDGIFAFNNGEESYVKRLSPIGAGADGRPTAIKILSDNPAYTPAALIGEEMNNLHVVGRVKCVIASL